MNSVGIVGMGWVGSSVAAALLARGYEGELLLNDLRPEIAEGEAMDFAHGALFYQRATVRASMVEAMRGCDAVVVSAGRGGKPGESRLALLRDNAAIAADLGKRLQGTRALIVMVSNPVDILTEVLRRASDLPQERVLGTGTMLDTARLRVELGDFLRVNPASIHAQVLGEHGDSSVMHWSRASIGGRSLRDWPHWSTELEARIGERVRRAAYEIISRKGATNHAIGLVTATLIKAVLKDERRVLTVSRLHKGVLKLGEVALSLPTVVGAGGAEQIIEPELDNAEHKALAHSAELLRTKLREVM